MKLHEKLALHLSDTVAVIGAGGKTTALWRLAEERRDAGAPVLVTTSTHILIPADSVCGYICLSGHHRCAAALLQAGTEHLRRLSLRGRKMHGVISLPVCCRTAGSAASAL